jgi:hypothetical protein
MGIGRMLVVFGFFAGIRVSAFAARALPLCGAAVTFFAAEPPQRK